jgi:hypothetical protein
MVNWFHIYQGDPTPQYTINLAHVASVTREDDTSWEVFVVDQAYSYTLEGDDLSRFRQATGL